LIGSTLKDRYLILSKLGKGGFGETFLAEDLGAFNRRCVIKRFSFHASDPDLYQSFKERFELEARTLMELGEHEQIPELYTYYPDGYLAQEFIVGQTLESVLSKEVRLPEERVKPILISLLTVLEFVHSKKKIHRDINPKNIILREPDGVPILIDFGAVKEVMTLPTDPHSKLRSGTITIGTEGYIAPEQGNGFPDCCSDLYSLGATAQCLLTGKNPKFLNAPRKGDGGWLRHTSGLSESFASVINKAIQLAAHDRYATASEMKGDLIHSRILIQEDDEPTRPFNRGEPLVDMATGQPLVAVNPPADFQLPIEHLYLGEGKQRGEHILYRKKDGQGVLHLPKDGEAATPFIIDRHLVTNRQFALFLNDPKISGDVSLTKINDVLAVTTADGSLLAADAPSFWRRNNTEPLGRLAGLTHAPQGWTPLAGSEHLPVVLVTALGASCYAAWLKGLPMKEAQAGFGLPCESQWINASLLEKDTGSLRKFPWGNKWERQRLNSLCYWAGHDLTEGEIESRSKAALTPVGNFPEGSSPCGLMDAFGNAWEWLKDSDGSGGFMIRGGAYTSPMPVFDAAVMYRQHNFLGPAIGFRCCWYI
jgi:serine/threonine protein kinase/formylglycine-generating enzyme required for sulfatase activity